jgi:excisionase family DNA binding protein
VLDGEVPTARSEALIHQGVAVTHWHFLGPEETVERAGGLLNQDSSVAGGCQGDRPRITYVEFANVCKGLLMTHKSDPQKLQDYLTVKEAAVFLGVSPSTLRNWDRAGKVKAVRHPVNGYRLYLQEHLRAILESVGAQQLGRA